MLQQCLHEGDVRKPIKKSQTKETSVVKSKARQTSITSMLQIQSLSKDSRRYKKHFFNKKYTATLAVRNIFGSHTGDNILHVV